MKIEMDDFERLTVRYAVYEAFTDHTEHYCVEELESLHVIYERLDPTRVEHDNAITITKDGD